MTTPAVKAGAGIADGSPWKTAQAFVGIIASCVAVAAHPLLPAAVITMTAPGELVNIGWRSLTTAAYWKLLAGRAK